MKQNKILTGIGVFMAIMLLMQSGCRKDDNASGNPGTMVTDVAQAYMYYFFIFREAETAWALVHENGYLTGTVLDTENRTISYVFSDKGKYSIDIVLKDWTWNASSATLSGKITVDLPADSSYMKKDKATISLSDFFINQQEVKGFSTITYSQNEEIDYYGYVLASGSIYSVDGNDILITSAITSGTFQRAQGSATIATPDDDIWTFNGTMTGKIRNAATLQYSNTVATQAPPVFDWNCSRKAQQGVCKLTVGKQEIIYDYGYDCESIIQISTVTYNDK
jgi:hypothetical protein